MRNGYVLHLKEYMSTPVIFHNMSNNKNNQITDNITTNDLRLIAN